MSAPIQSADVIAGDIAGRNHESPISFQDRAAAAGVDFIYRNGEELGALAILESLGGGVGLLDYDRDGMLDVFFPGGGAFDPATGVKSGGPRRLDPPYSGGGEIIDATTGVQGFPGALYRQLAPWQFAPVTNAAGVGMKSHYTHGVAAADADNDGFPDLLVTGYGGLQFFRNQGDGTFTECTLASGLDDRLWSSSAAWGDLNADGNPDLYVAHYVDWSPENHPACTSVSGDRPDVCPPKRFQPLPDVMYFGQGDSTFRDVSREAGLSELGKGLGVVLADLDVDGRMDIYVANDTVPNLFYRNLGGGKFADLSDTSGTALNDRGRPDGSMGVDVGDYNLDGLPDLWVSNYELESNTLYRDFGDGLFRHVSQTTGVTAVGARYVGWGTVFFDADLDGDEDIFVSNGHVVHFPNAAPVFQTPLLFENLDGKRLVNVAAAAGEWMSAPHAGRGCASGDLDGDGDLDLVVSSVNQPAALLENRTDVERHWLEIRLVGTASNRDALGARVTVQTADVAQSRQVKGGGSYASTSAPDLHFGLNHADDVTEVEIVWPSGWVQRIPRLDADQRHIIIEPIDRESN